MTVRTATSSGGDRKQLTQLRIRTFVALGLLVLLSAILLFIQTAPPVTAVLGILLMWICALPALLYLQGIDDSPLPFLPYVGAYYLVFFALPIFAAPLEIHSGEKVVLYGFVLLDSVSAQVTALVAGGVGLMFGAYYAAARLLFAGMPRFRLQTADAAQGQLAILCWILLSASILYRVTDFLRPIPSIIQLLDPASYLSIGYLFLQWRRGTLPHWHVIGLLVVLPLELFARARFLLITDLLLLGVFFAFVLWRMRMIRTLAVIGIASVVLIATYNVTIAARSLGTTFVEKVTESIREVGRILDNEQITHVAEPPFPTVTYDRRIAPLIHRVSHIWVFEAVWRRTPDTVPYWKGETYKPLLTSFVPRFLYPNKPEERAGNTFGHRYFFRNVPGAAPEKTSVNIPWIIELFINFGPPGVLIGMAVFGVLLGFLNRVFNANGMSDLEFLIGLVIIFRLGYQESNFSVMCGSLLPLFVAFVLYFVLGTLVMRRLTYRSNRSGKIHP